ncbi:MAG: hypothetical protein LBH67_02060 [Rickettsia sp.]|nr:hypothetical protein [Rickettsia sp.]
MFLGNADCIKIKKIDFNSNISYIRLRDFTRSRDAKMIRKDHLATVPLLSLSLEVIILKGVNWTTEQMQAIARLNAYKNAKLLWYGSTNSGKKSLAQCDYPKYPNYDNDLKLVKGSSNFSYHVHFVSSGAGYKGVSLSFYDYCDENGNYLNYMGQGGGLASGVIGGQAWLNSDIDITSLLNKDNAIRFECGFFAGIAGAAHVNLYHADAADTWFVGTGTFYVSGVGAGEYGGVGTLAYSRWV